MLLIIIINEKSRVLDTFVRNKSFGQLSNISLEKFMLIKTFDSKFSDQNSNPKNKYHTSYSLKYNI